MLIMWIMNNQDRGPHLSIRQFHGGFPQHRSCQNVIQRYIIGLNKILTIEFLLMTKHTWDGGLMHLSLCSFILSGLPLTCSMQTLHLNCCCRRGFAKFSGVLIVSKAFLIGSSFLPDEYLLPPAMFLWSNWI